MPISINLVRPFLTYSDNLAQRLIKCQELSEDYSRKALEFLMKNFFLLRRFLGLQDFDLFQQLVDKLLNGLDLLGSRCRRLAINFIQFLSG